jgi:hypothetical protein
MFFYRILRYISFVSSLAILLVLYYVFKAIKGLFTGNKYSFVEWIDEIGYELYSFPGKWSKVILITSFVAMLLTNTTVHQLVGINNLELKPEGTYCFYVKATSPTGKSYTLPAQIRIEKETDEVGEKTRTRTYFYIQKVYFTNGGYLDTDDGEPDEIDQASYFYEDFDDYASWDLVLLNEHAYSPYVHETNNADWLDLTFLSIETISFIIVLVALLRQTPADSNKENV